MVRTRAALGCCTQSSRCIVCSGRMVIAFACEPSMAAVVQDLCCWRLSASRGCLARFGLVWRLGTLLLQLGGQQQQSWNRSVGVVARAARTPRQTLALIEDTVHFFLLFSLLHLCDFCHVQAFLLQHFQPCSPDWWHCLLWRCVL